MEHRMDSLRSRRRFPNCLYRASRVGKAIQERPVSRALTQTSNEPCPIKGSREGGTYSDHEVSSCP